MPYTKKNCFYIIPRVPFPPVGGDRLKYFSSIKVLAKQFNLHVIIVSDVRLTKEAEAFLQQHTASYKFFCFKKTAFLVNVIKGIFSKNPLQVCYYYFKQVDDYCKATIQPGDIVIANLIRTALYAFNLSNKKILNFEDSIFLNYKASITKVSSLLWKIIYMFELSRLKSFEEKCIKIFNLSTFVNEAEQLYYANLGNTIWLPNGVSDELCNREFTTPPPKFKEVAYLGKMDYQPNVDAVVWFANNVISKYPDIHLKIVGAFPNNTVLNLKNKYPANITITGYVDDPFAIMRGAVAVVAPMQTGAGLQNKILEAMATGCLLLGSSLGTKPIKGAINGQHLIVCDTGDEFARMIYKAAANPEFADAIGIEARKLIMNQYTWGIYSQRLFRAMEQL